MRTAGVLRREASEDRSHCCHVPGCTLKFGEMHECRLVTAHAFNTHGVVEHVCSA